MKCFKISFQVLMALFLVFGTLGVSSTGATVVKADSTALTLPYSQNWTNTSLITVNDDWSGVSGIVGYRGDGLTTANDVNAQTVLIDDNPGVVTVFANQPSGSTGSGGIMEFDGIANPVIAMQGSGTADAPYLLINLNTAGNQNISVSYKVRDVDGSADNSSQQVALHFRVGGSGAFTNVPDAYIADATTGGTATQETSVSATLPNEANNQPLVQLRIMTTNAAGNDEWVGIDDIAVTGTPIVGDVAPSVVSTTPSNGSTALKSDNIVVTFSEPVTVADGWYSISCDTSGLHIASMADADPVYTLDPAIDFTSGETCTVTIDHAKVSDKDLDDATADLMVADYVFSFSIAESCGDTFTPIYAIQGNGANSPLVGQDISTEGVVTADLQTTKKGFYIQTPSTEVDADPLTSEGLFVYTGSTPLTLTVGNRVRVIGKVVEFSGLTEISPVTTVVNCGASGETVLPVELSLPFTDTNAANLEPVENMLVHFVQPLVINEYYNFDRYGEIVLGSKRLDNPTNVVAPGAPAIALQAANNLDKITLDDGVSAQNPEFLPHPNGGRFCQGTLVGTADCPVANIFRGGDEVSNLTAVVDYVAGGWKLVKTQPATYFAANPRTSAPDLVAGELRISSINTLNYFLSTGSICGPLGDQGCRGAENAEELNRQRTKTIATVIGMASDITGLLELENDNPTATTASGPDYAIKDIVAGLNSVAGDGTYDYIRTGAIGGDAIKAGIVYKPARVTPVGNPAYLTSSVDPDFIDTCNRPVLAQTFQDLATGQKFTLAVNHLKSKGSACEALNDADTGDGQGNANLTRTMAAEAQVKWLEADPTETDSEMYLIMGDLNSYAMEDPITAIKAGADGVAGTTDDYFDLVQRFRELFHYPNSYGYVFDGQAGYLDGALANRLMASYVLDCKEWHINSDEADALDYNTNFRGTAQKALWQPDTYRSSDHDPVIVTLTLNHAPVANAQSVTTAEDTAVAINLVATDVDDDNLTYSIVEGPTNGTLSGTAPALTYTPNADFHGSDSFTYSVNDGTLGSNVATVTITVNSVLDAPTINSTDLAGPYMVGLKQDFHVTLTNPDNGDAFTNVLARFNLEGIKLADIASFQYFESQDGQWYNLPLVETTTGVTGDFGPASGFTMGVPYNATSSFRVTFNTPGTYPATIVLYDVAAKPEKVLDTYKADVEVAEDLEVTDVVLQRSVDQAAWYKVPGTYAGGFAMPLLPSQEYYYFDVSTLTVNRPIADGSYPFSITSNPGTAFFAYWAERGVVNGATGWQGQMWQIINGKAPIFWLKVVGTEYTLIDGLQGEPNLLRINGAYFPGDYTFTGSVTDQLGFTDEVPVNITFNDVPVVADQTLSVDEDSTLGIDLTAVDLYPGTLTWVRNTEPTNGVLSGTAPALTYTPNADFHGSDSFTYSVNDGTLGSNVATVTIVVKAVNDTPGAEDQSLTTAEDTPLNGILVAKDVDMDSLTFSKVTGPAKGSVVVNTDGTFTYTPDLNYNGPDSFTFTANDGTANSIAATISITVTPVNDAPLANDQSVGTEEDTPVTIAPTGSDVEGSLLTFSKVSDPANGSVVVNANGTFTYTPALNYNGPDSFTFKAKDGTTDSIAATISITVTPLNDAPVANAQTVTTPEDTALTITPNATDVDGDPLSYVIVSGAAHGTAVVSGGVIIYKPVANYNGPDSFIYKANDGTVDSNEATVSITVTPVNDTPQAVNDIYNTNQDTTLVVSKADGVMKNDKDVDLDSMAVTLLSETTHGTLTLLGDGSFTYVPAPGFFGTDTFTYQLVTYPSLVAVDGWVDQATVTINVHEVVPPTNYLYLPLITK